MAHVQHDECAKCWACPDCDARWCITVSDFSHSCGQDNLDDRPKQGSYFASPLQVCIRCGDEFAGYIEDDVCEDCVSDPSGEVY